MLGDVRAATLITGASSGIGEELAYRFAQNRDPLVLVALPPDAAALQRVGAKCRELGAAEVHCIEADLSRADSIDAIERELTALGLYPRILVNNAGFGVMTPFASGSEEQQIKSILVNCVALTALSRRFLPGMIARKNGGILNTASTGGMVPGPGMAIYFATKAFVISLTEALEHELRGTGVSVTALCPGPTVTAFLERSGMTSSQMFVSMKAMTASEVAEIGYRAFQRRKTVQIAGVRNWFAMLGLRLMPRRMRLNTIWKLHQPTPAG